MCTVILLIIFLRTVFFLCTKYYLDNFALENTLLKER
jgi:hypothetical protein